MIYQGGHWPEAWSGKLQTSALSLMPEGLLDAVNEKQAIDLFGFLMSTAPPQTSEATQSATSGKAGGLK